MKPDMDARALAKFNQASHKRAVKHDRCEIEFCNICEGGLFVCADCGAAEIEAEQEHCAERRLAASTGAAPVGMTDEIVERAHKKLMAELFVVCQPGNGDVFAFMDDHPEVIRAALEAAALSAAPLPLDGEPVAHIIDDGRGKRRSRRALLVEHYDPRKPEFWAGGMAPPDYTVTPLYATNEDDLIATYRDCFAELTAKATPYGNSEDITAYIIPAGPLHRAAGKLGFQFFGGEQACLEWQRRALLAEAMKTHISDMEERVIPDIEAAIQERERAAVELRYPRATPRNEEAPMAFVNCTCYDDASRRLCLKKDRCTVTEAYSTAPIEEAPMAEGLWEIDSTTDSPILMYEKCSVIQDDQALYVMNLIRADLSNGTTLASQLKEYEAGCNDLRNDDATRRGYAFALRLLRPIITTASRKEAPMAEGVDALTKALEAIRDYPKHSRLDALENQDAMVRIAEVALSLHAIKSTIIDPVPEGPHKFARTVEALDVYIYQKMKNIAAAIRETNSRLQELAVKLDEPDKQRIYTKTIQDGSGEFSLRWSNVALSRAIKSDAVGALEEDAHVIAVIERELGSWECYGPDEMLTTVSGLIAAEREVFRAALSAGSGS